MGLNVLIVDDEDAHREGLAAHLPWADLGYHPPHLAAGGPEALELATHIPFDVVLADVNMSGMTGIDVVRLLKAENRSLCALMISGYGEFEYVQESMEAGADGYVLKPVQLAEVQGWLVKFRRIHEIRLEVARQDEALVRRSQENLAAARQRFLYSLVTETWRPEAELAQAAGSLGLVTPPGPWRLLTLEGSQAPVANEAPPVVSRGLSALEMVLANRGRGAAVGVFYRPWEAMLLVFAGPGGVTSEEDLKDTVATGLGGLDLGARFHVAYSPPLDRWDLVRNAYWDNRATLGEVRHADGLLILSSREQNRNAGSDTTLLHQLQERVLGGLRAGAYTDLAPDLDALERAVTSDLRFSFPLVQALYLQIAAAVLALVEESTEARDPQPVGVFQNLLSATDGPDLARRTAAFVLEVAEELQRQATKKRHHCVDQCLVLIDTHYAEDLTLKDLAAAVELNPSYLSVLFKSVVGMTASDYLTKVRMDKAKELLRQHELKVYQISAMVGFKTIGYFSTVFHREVGVTPGQYREGKGN